MSTNENYTTLIDEIDFNGIKGIRFSAGGYEALVLPGLGANLIELKDNTRGLSLMRNISDIEAFKARSHVFGIPVLFPPNRIAGGEFTANGRIYNFPVNDSSKQNHIHGFLRHRAWDVGKMEIKDETAEVELFFNADKNTDFYEYLPHEFEIRLTYRLSKEGLEQKATILNKSTDKMPMALGFHTAFNVTFHPDSNPNDCRLKVSVGKKWELSEEGLPTGKLMPLGGEDEKLRNGGVLPQGKPMLEHFTAKPIKLDGRDFNGAIIEDVTKGLKLVYEVGNEYKHWMIWNETGDKGFVCPEPQTWAVNAPNLDFADEITGMKLLGPGGTWSESCRIYVVGE